MPLDARPNSTPRPFVARFARRSALFVLSVVAALLLVEFALSMITPKSPIFDPRLALYPYFRVERQPRLRGLADTALISTNAWGLRGSDPPIPFRGAYSIITIGGSTTMCALNDDDRTWPAVMESRLNEAGGLGRPVWVGNAGIDGQTSWGHKVVMERVVETVKPDCVLLLVGLNDASLCLANRQTSGTQDEWLVVDPEKSKKSRLFWKSQLLQFLWLEQKLRTRKTVSGGYVHRPVTFPKTLQQDGYPPDFQTSDTDLLRALALPDTIAERYVENLRGLIRIGKSIPVRMVFLSQPLLHGYGARDYDGALIDLEAPSGIRWLSAPDRVLTIAELEMLMLYFNRITGRVAREEGVEFFDLAAHVPRDQNYFYDGIHYTDAGSDVVGRAVAGYLKAGSVGPVTSVSPALL